ncbi:hypothetical protein EYF80_048115 [Liparis tanakae]|uniref:Uncharacterized protein n=1 Tax=Liparis tanakae TaxID=230148 RepID=A0A4Z2FKF3_9TELE|nr:hypothetical protein EYF80_048115 [Liparis tanakae]
MEMMVGGRCARTQSRPLTPVSKSTYKHRSSLFPLPPLPTPQHPEDIQDHFKAGGKEKRKIQREAEPILKDCWTSSDTPEPAFRRHHDTVTTSGYWDVLPDGFCRPCGHGTTNRVKAPGTVQNKQIDESRISASA